LNYKVIYEVKKRYIKDIYKLYQNEWWTKGRDKKSIKVMLKNSDITIGVVKDKKLIAFVRVLSDFIYKAEIFDVIVHPKYRKRGLGELLIREILNHKKLKKVQQFNLQCKSEVAPFYEQFGFERVEGLEFMRKSQKTHFGA
jgi:predicted GNAT family N-acyltransferase